MCWKIFGYVSTNLVIILWKFSRNFSEIVKKPWNHFWEKISEFIIEKQSIFEEILKKLKIIFCENTEKLILEKCAEILKQFCHDFRKI